MSGWGVARYLPNVYTQNVRRDDADIRTGIRQTEAIETQVYYTLAAFIVLADDLLQGRGTFTFIRSIPRSVGLIEQQHVCMNG